MTIVDILPLYEKNFIHIDAVAFLLGTTRKGAQAAIYKARRNHFKKKPTPVKKENWDVFLNALEQVEDKSLIKILEKQQ